MKSFLEGRPVVSRNGAAVPTAQRGLTDSQLPSFDIPRRDTTVASLPEAAMPAAAAARAHTHEKAIETVEVDGVVQTIIITCGCGERIEVHCGY